MSWWFGLEAPLTPDAPRFGSQSGRRQTLILITLGRENLLDPVNIVGILVP